MKYKVLTYYAFSIVFTVIFITGVKVLLRVNCAPESSMLSQKSSSPPIVVSNQIKSFAIWTFWMMHCRCQHGHRTAAWFSSDRRWCAHKSCPRITFCGKHCVHWANHVNAFQSKQMIRCICCIRRVRHPSQRVYNGQPVAIWWIWCIRWAPFMVWSQPMCGGQHPIWVGSLVTRIFAMDRCCLVRRVLCMRVNQIEHPIQANTSVSLNNIKCLRCFQFRRLFVLFVERIQMLSTVALIILKRCGRFLWLASIVIWRRKTGLHAHSKCLFWIIGGKVSCWRLNFIFPYVMCTNIDVNAFYSRDWFSYNG